MANKEMPKKKLREKSLVIGDKVAVATPNRTYFCVIYKVLKPKFSGLHFDYITVDELGGK